MRTTCRITVALLVAVLVVTSLSLRAGVAAPGIGTADPRLAAQNVDWMSSDEASRLDLGFPVMVPTWIPGPFGGSPSIQASGGYYSLYWMNSGGASTFLYITGEVGGALPAGSPADLNNQLFINASVQGYEAIHDVTSIYDNVWWIAGGVLYTVSSNNMTGTDSLSLANSLVALEPPAAPEPDPVEEEPTEPPVEAEPTTPPEAEEPEPETGPTGTIDNPASVAAGGTATLWVYPSDVGTLRSTDGWFVDSGATFITELTGGEVLWQAPSVTSETTIEFTLLDAQTGEITDWSSIEVYPVEAPVEAEESVSEEPEAEPVATEEAASEAEEAPDVAEVESEAAEVVEAALEPTAVEASANTADGSGGGTASLDETLAAVQTAASGGATGLTLSDGTAGPQLPSGSDGTGGIRMVTIP